jgi:hypothetical protein
VRAPRPRRALGQLGRRPLLEGLATDAALLGGLGMVAFGFALVALPAGFIVGGLLLAGGALVLGKRPS